MVHFVQPACQHGRQWTHLDLGRVVEVLRALALEEAQPVEDVGEEGEEEEAGHNGEDEDPERDTPALGGHHSHHLHSSPTLTCVQGGAFKLRF